MLASHRLTRVTAVLVCSLLASLAVAYATHLGPGVSPDSTAFLSTANRFLGRLGGAPLQGKLNRFSPPGYSAVLAVGRLVTGADAASFSRWMNTLLVAANVGLIALMLRRATRGRWLPIAGAAAMAGSVDMLTIHAMTWTEPLFILLAYLGLLMLAEAMRSGRAWPILVAAAPVAGSVLVRYVGVSTIAAGAFAILLWGRAPIRRRVLWATAFALVASLPLLLWLLAQPMGHRAVVHGFAMDWISTGLISLVGWLTPISLWSNPAAAAAALSIALVAGVLAYPVLRSRAVGVSPSMDGLTAPIADELPRLLGVFVCAYVLVLISARLFVDTSIVLDPRILAPIYPAAVTLILLFGDRLLRDRARQAAAAAFVAWLMMACVADVRWARDAHAIGLGYSGRVWQDSEIMAQVRRLPAQLRIYSNGDDAITYLALRPATRLPDRVNATTLLPNPEYAADLQAIGGQVAAGQAVIVYLDGIRDRWFLPTIADMPTEWNLTAAARAGDGAIYSTATK